MARTEHDSDCGRRDSRYPIFSAQQIFPDQEHGPEPGGYPVPGNCGAGKEAGGGDHRQLRRGGGKRVCGQPHCVHGGVQLCGGPRIEPDLPDGPHHRLRAKLRPVRL